MSEQQTNYSYDAKNSRVWTWSERYGEMEKNRDLKQLRADLPAATRLDDAALNDYLDVVHRNVFWYLRNQKKQRTLYYVNVVLALVLVVLIPYSCYTIAILAQGSGVTAGVASAQFTTVLTGGVALHRVIMSCLLRRNVALGFGRAGAELRQLHIDLMERWTRPTAPDDPGLLKTELFATARKARAAINLETEAYITTFAGVRVNPGKLLKSAAATSKTLLDDFGGRIVDKMKNSETPAEQRVEGVKKAHLQLIELRSRVRLLGRQLTRLTAERELAVDRSRLDTLAQEIQSVQVRMAETENRLATAQARYTARPASSDAKPSAGRV